MVPKVYLVEYERDNPGGKGSRVVKKGLDVQEEREIEREIKYIL